MTVKQLKQELENISDNTEIFLAQRKTEFGYGLLNSAYTKEIFFTEDENPSEDEIAEAPIELVLILDEE